MSANNIAIISLIINGIVMVILTITAIYTKAQIRKQYEWKRRKTTQEILDRFVFGEFPELRDRLEEHLGCKIWDKNQTYETIKNEFDKDKISEIDRYLKRILNIFETIAINIKNNIIDEDICYEYLGFIFTEYFRWSESFVDKIVIESKDHTIWIEFKNYGKIWKNRIQGEKEKYNKNLTSLGKNKL